MNIIGTLLIITFTDPTTLNTIIQISKAIGGTGIVGGLFLLVRKQRSKINTMKSDNDKAQDARLDKITDKLELLIDGVNKQNVLTGVLVNNHENLKSDVEENKSDIRNLKEKVNCLETDFNIQKTKIDLHLKG